MLQYNLPQHSYEEIREAVIETILPDQIVEWEELKKGVSRLFANRENKQPQYQPQQYGNQYWLLHPFDTELTRDVFWDLFRQGFITLGSSDNNPQWPFFRLSHFGKKTLGSQNPNRFHDTSSFLNLVKNQVPDITREAITYLNEAVSAFYTGCLLAACVMLGVAAEVEFLRLIDTATKGTTYGQNFSHLPNNGSIHGKIMKFHNCLRPLISSLPYKATEDLEANFSTIQSLLRIARNDAGHPTGASPKREQVYVYLQLFIPFSGQLMRLREALA